MYENFSLKHLNTFGLDVKCKYFVQPDSVKDVLAFSRTEIFKTHEVLILGDGSNILFTGDFKGLCIRSAIKDWEIVEETGKEVLIKAGSGINWAESFIPRILSFGFWGLENLSLIPGTVGASAFQNIGAYGVEVKDLIEKVEGVDFQTGNIEQFTKRECEFGYRTSKFKKELQDSFLITSVYFRLSKIPKPVLSYGRLNEYFQNKKADLESISSYIISERTKKLPDPKELGNAGSFFKNPIVEQTRSLEIQGDYPDVPLYQAGANLFKIPAGWLIEQCGWKGKREGKVGVYPRHALVLVNYGLATGKDIFRFAEKIRVSVLRRFGLDMEREVRVV